MTWWMDIGKTILTAGGTAAFLGIGGYFWREKILKWFSSPLEEGLKEANSYYKRFVSRQESIEDELKKLRNREIEVNRRTAWSEIATALLRYHIAFDKSVNASCLAAVRKKSPFKEDETYKKLEKADLMGEQFEEALASNAVYIDDDQLAGEVQALVSDSKNAFNWICLMHDGGQDFVPLRKDLETLQKKFDQLVVEYRSKLQIHLGAKTMAQHVKTMEWLSQNKDKETSLFPEFESEEP